MSLKNKVATITGGSSGIGAAIAVKFAEEGAYVAIVGRNEDRLKKVATECNGSLAINADVAKDEDCIRVIQETIAHFGKIDILVNNAGIGALVSIKSEEAIATFDDIMKTNLRSTVRLTNLAAEHLIKTKGNIVNISSNAGMSVKLGIGGFAYSVSKAAMDHFTKCVALDLSADGVRVNSVNPGPVRTPMMNPNDESMFKDKCALKRICEPEEIADLVQFLASDKAVAITGSTYLIDNGMLVGGQIIFC